MRGQRQSFVHVDPKDIRHSTFLNSCVQGVTTIFSMYPHLKPHLYSRRRQAIGQGDLDVPRTSLTFATV